MHFEEIDIHSVADNAVTLFGRRWALLTAGEARSFNTMTVSWGTLGELWSRPVVTAYVRPTRYTYEFVEREAFFTLSFFGEEQRPALNLCGAKSGRELDKVAAAGLTPVDTDCGAMTFAEAELVFVCRKLYRNDFIPADFIEPQIVAEYGDMAYHRQYIAEVVQVLRRS